MMRGSFPRLTGEYLYIVTIELCNITAKLHSEGLCSWPPDNRSVAPKGGMGQFGAAVSATSFRRWTFRR